MKKTFLKAVALTAAISFGTASIGFAAGRSIGVGDISVYKNGQLVTKLTGQNPIEDDALLVCNGKCLIKSEGISLFGADSTKMAVTNEQDSFKLYMKAGKVDYVISSNVRQIIFYTPQGTYTVAEVVFNADNQSVVKGSVVVGSDGQTEISVTEGRLVFATADGMKVVDAKSKIILAVTPAEAGAAGAAGPGYATGLVVFGGLVAAAVGTAIIVSENDDSSTPASPSN